MGRVDDGPGAARISRKTADFLGDSPPAWRARFGAYTWQETSIGESGAAVFRLVRPGYAPLFAKVESQGPFSDVAAEGARLQWLAEQGVPAPRVVATARHAGRDWLLVTALPGRDAASVRGMQPVQVVILVAGALRRLHSLPANGCPFDQRLAVRIAAARARVTAGVVDENDFDDERRGRTAAEVMQAVLASRPAVEEVVVTHGDACLPNLMIDGDQFAGFVDCARVGVADRYQDLALACRSIAHNLGKRWVSVFFTAYGLAEPDAERVAFYTLLDELF